MEYFTYGQKEIDYLKNSDEVLGKYIDSVGMIERTVNKDVFGALIESIVSQQISSKAAETVTAKLIDKVGVLSPKALDITEIEEIQACGMTYRKASYIKNAANAAISGEIDFDGLYKLTDEDIIKTLVKLKGVGVWTAEMLLIFSLCRLDVVSYDDLAIRRGIMYLYGLEELTKAEFKKIREKYSPYGTIASLYLWHKSVEK